MVDLTTNTNALPIYIVDSTGAPVSASNPGSFNRVNGSIVFQDSTTALAANATFTGVSRTTGATFAGAPSAYVLFVAESFADQAGTLFIDKSLDGTTWRQVASVATTANATGTLTARLTAPFYRVRFTNGATLNTVFALTSSLTSA